MAMFPWHKQMVESINPPDRVRPVMDRVAGVNFPYRGSETHGVDPTDSVDIDPEEADYGTTVAVPLEPETEDIEPVPVRIVSASSKELRTFRVIREYCRGNEPARRIIGQDENRTTVRIKNLHASDLLYISDMGFNDVGMGYPIAGGQELEVSAETAIYAKASAANDISIAMFVEWTQPQ
jgi:hypothetical protein